ncbi:MAG: acyl-ACP--UDP-N-acetylglucosamine O-acyltransferase [Candidatus Gastranaerophilales bacterium]|nr:acyl-ACP--UDP-N-acetylglucosamine O-acyltransferase [Candidatus Gastranaerophilales bacterium]
MTIHKTAIIADNAVIPASCEIGPNVIIGEDVVLGENVKIIANAYLEYCEIGSGTIIYPFASLGTSPQDLSYHGQKTKAVIGENCIIKEYVTINRAAGEDGAVTKVGNKCLFMASSHVAHNCVVEDEAIFANLATIGGHVHVGKGAFLGGMSVYHQNIRIGEYVIISGFSASRMDIPPFSKADGRPAIIHGPNTIGLKRRGFTPEERKNIREAYKLIQSRTHTLTEVVEILEKEYPNDKNVLRIADFIKTSKRGIYLSRCNDLEDVEV